MSFPKTEAPVLVPEPASPAPLYSNSRNSQKRLPRIAAVSWVAAQIRAHWIGMVLPLSILAIWETSTRLKWIKPHFLPSPESVATGFYSMLVESGLLLDVWASAVIIAQGLVFGTLAGLLLGFAAGLSKTVEKFLGPTLDSVRQVPPLAWTPLLILWLGVGNVGKVALIGKAVFFPIFLNTIQGIRGASKDHIEVGKVFGYSRIMMLRKIILPSALPTIFVGLRYAVGMAWGVMIGAELIGSRYGLGFRLSLAQDNLLTDQVFVIIIMIGLIGYILDLIIRKIEARVLHWRKVYEG